MIDVTRSQPAPSSLKTRKRYGGQDVRKRLHEDFLGKCYLCESVLPPGRMQIDHRRGQDPETLIYDWSNLFPACNCNLHRSKTYPPLLDPSAGHRVETRLVQWLDGTTEPKFCAASETDDQARNTALELDRCHGRDHTHGSDLRTAISRRLNLVWPDVFHYERARKSTPTAEVDIQRLKTTVRGHLSRRAPFTMLVRSVFAKFFSDDEWAALID
jgi:hypothetical protein